MNKFTYQINTDSETGKLFQVYLYVSKNLFCYYLPYEFISKNYIHGMHMEEDKIEAEICLSICRDELIDRGLIDE